MKDVDVLDWWILVGLSLIVIGIAIIWWPLALITVGGMIVASAAIAAMNDVRSGPVE